MKRSLALLIFAGCTARRIDALTEAGWLGEACHASMEVQGRITPKFAAAHLRGAPAVDVQLATDPDLVAAPGYGSTWAMVDVDVQAKDPSYVASYLVIEIPGWRGCREGECGPDWLERRLTGSPDPTPGRAGRGFARLFRALVGVTLLPLTLTVDVLAAAPRALTPRARRGPTVTESLLGRWANEDGVPQDPPAVSMACDGTGACRARVPLLPAPNPEKLPPALLFTWRHEGCAVVGAWTWPEQGNAWPGTLNLAQVEPDGLGVDPGAR